MTTPTCSIHSLGQAAALLQAMPGQIKQAATALRIEPIIIINSVPHYEENDLQKIREHLTSKQKP